MAPNELDASLLLIPMVGFLPADDPRDHRHGRRHREMPAAATVLSLRYNTESAVDGLPGRRRCLPRLQLLARRQLHPARPVCRRAADVRAAPRRCATMSGCWRRNTIPSSPTAGRQFPAGLFASRAHQYGAQPQHLGGSGAPALRRRRPGSGGGERGRELARARDWAELSLPGPAGLARCDAGRSRSWAPFVPWIASLRSQ